MANIYNYWDTTEGYSDWAAPRTWDQRFRSEKYFLEKIYQPGMSVLDIGCATGDLYSGLKGRYGDHRYVGIDTSSVMITGGKKMHPKAEFYVGDVNKEDIIKDQKFDLVTATGVFQHEPEYKSLLNKMIKFTKDSGYILFDYKLFHTHSSISDINKSYCDLPDKLYFNVLNFQDALKWLQGLDNISSIEMFGYYSGTHKSVTLPEDVTEQVCSAHVLLKKENSDSVALVNIELPDDFIHSF